MGALAVAALSYDGHESKPTRGGLAYSPLVVD